MAFLGAGPFAAVTGALEHGVAKPPACLLTAPLAAGMMELASEVRSLSLTALAAKAQAQTKEAEVTQLRAALYQALGLAAGLNAGLQREQARTTELHREKRALQEQLHASGLKVKALEGSCYLLESEQEALQDELALAQSHMHAQGEQIRALALELVRAHFESTLDIRPDSCMSEEEFCGVPFGGALYPAAGPFALAPALPPPARPPAPGPGEQLDFCLDIDSAALLGQDFLAVLGDDSASAATTAAAHLSSAPALLPSLPAASALLGGVSGGGEHGGPTSSAPEAVPPQPTFASWAISSAPATDSLSPDSHAPSLQALESMFSQLSEHVSLLPAHPSCKRSLHRQPSPEPSVAPLAGREQGSGGGERVKSDPGSWELWTSEETWTLSGTDLARSSPGERARSGAGDGSEGLTCDGSCSSPSTAASGSSTQGSASYGGELEEGVREALPAPRRSSGGGSSSGARVWAFPGRIGGHLMANCGGGGLAGCLPAASGPTSSSGAAVTTFGRASSSGGDVLGAKHSPSN